MKFKRYIFICWFQGLEHLKRHPKSVVFQENLKNWATLNPSWTVKLISDKELRKACRLFSKECLALYDSFDLIHLKIDLGRYVLLYLYGGMYVDMDMYVLRGLQTSRVINKLIHKIRNDIPVIALSSLNLDVLESMLFFGKKQTINNAMMFASQKHPILRLLIHTIIKDYPDNTGLDSFTKVQNITGPLRINKFFSIFLDNQCSFLIKVFPHYYFEPSPAYGHSDIREETLAIHKMEMSWIPPNIKQVIEYYYITKPFILPTLLIIYIILRG